jgi:hypothetical protein
MQKKITLNKRKEMQRLGDIKPNPRITQLKIHIVIKQTKRSALNNFNTNSLNKGAT